MPLAIAFDQERIAEFCRKWRVKEMSVFGSALRADYGPGSDVDVLVDIEDSAPWTAFDLVDMIDELKDIFGCDVDLIEKSAMRNPFRRYEILRTREVIYAA
jgi:predicted nucleotidyltransferase